MALKPGTKMVDSGVEWIGQMPEGWETRRLKEVSTVNPRVRLPQKGNISFVPMERLLFGSVDTSLEMNSEEAGNYTRFEDGDVLIAKVTPCFENGKAAIARTLVNGVGVGSSEITPIRPKRIHPEYLLMVMQAPAFVDAGVATMNGTAGLQRVSTSFWKDTPVPYPPLSTQQAIANYLDHHLGLIDEERNIISKRIELLKEKRSALIFEVVTGKRTLVEAQHLAGLDDWSDIIGSGPVVAAPTTRADDPFGKSGRLMDSGVEWIGEMPEGWEVSKMKSFGGFRTGRNPDTKNEGTIPVYGSSEKSFDSTARAISSGPAVCIGRKGTIDKPFFVRGHFWAVDTCMYSEVPGDSHSIDFVKHWLHIIPWDEVGTKTALPSLTQSDVNNLHIATPPLPLQQKIADFLDYETGLIDKEIELLTAKNELLSDKRKALIFEAVTGKIEING